MARSGDVLNTVSAQLEQVLPTVVDWTHQQDLISQLPQPPTTHEGVSRYGFRQALKTIMGGAYQKVNLNAGSYGNSSMMTFDKLQGGYFSSSLGIGIDQETVLDLSSPGASLVEDVTTRLLSDAQDQIIRFNSLNIIQNGLGQLTSSSSAYSSGTYTFNGASDIYGIARLFEGQQVDVWDSTLATKRGTAYVTKINETSKTATVTTSGLTSPASGDILLISGLDAYGPATPVTGQSTYPNLTGSANGIGGDSWIHGLEFVLDTNASGYYFTVQRSTYPSQLLAKSVSAGTSQLNFNHAQQLRALVAYAKGDKAAQDLRMLLHPGHLMSLQDDLQTVQIMDIGNGANLVDRIPGASPYEGMEFTFGGLTARVTRIAPKDKVLSYNQGMQGWVKFGKEFDWLPGGTVGVFHQGQAVASSLTTPAAYMQAFLWAYCEYFCPHPGQLGVITGLTVNSQF